MGTRSTYRRTLCYYPESIQLHMNCRIFQLQPSDSPMCRRHGTLHNIRRQMQAISALKYHTIKMWQFTTKISCRLLVADKWNLHSWYPSRCC